jgi:hypothetical protein
MSALFGFLTRSVGWLIAIIGFLVAGLTYYVGHSGHLLFEPTLGLGAPGVGGRLCAVCDLGAVVFAAAEHVRGSRRAVSLRGWMVACHPPFT